MLDELTAVWPRLKKFARLYPELPITCRVNKIIKRNLMRLRKTPDDARLQAQIRKNLADVNNEIAKLAA